MSVSYGGDSITFADGSVQSGGWTGFRNRIINGAMVIDQRYVGSANTVGGASYVLDRWMGSNATDGTITIQQVADAPTGFYNSMKFTVGTADTSIGSTQYCYFRQPIEGYNLLDLDFGLSTAKTVTLSFWVKSSVNGLFSGNLASTNHDRCSCFTYTINQANTWEYKTVTITGDTTGTWNKTNGIGAYLHFCLATGTTYQQSVTNTFQAGTYLGYTGTTNLLATSGNTFQITGVQFEKGSTASSFEYRPYGTEKLLCMRYFEKTYQDDEAPNRVNPNTANALTGVATSTTNIATHWKFSVPKRTSPTIQYYSWNGTGAGKWANLGNSDFTVSSPWSSGVMGFARLDSTGLTAGAFYWGFATADAEL